MLSLVHILYGVQSKAIRQMPTLPARWENIQLREVVSDSRDVTPRSLFVALVGERTDGHRYLDDVAARGAQAALVSAEAARAVWPADGATGRPWALIHPATGEGLAEAPANAFLLIAVDDPLMALQRLAAYHRRQFSPNVIGITGSVGKTSTKEVVAAVVSQQFRTLKNKRSFNSDVTVPTSILDLNADHEVVVQEIGMWAPGEIRFLCTIVQPKIGIVTNVGPSHLERLGSIDAITNAKAELVESLSADGVAILNGDDERVRAMATRTRARVLFYGRDPSADVWADNIQSHGLNGISFDAHYEAQSVSINVRLVGVHNVYTCLAAIAAGLSLGMSWDAIRAGLNGKDVQSRIVIVPGPSGATLIDDSYNAAPLSTLAALDLLASLDGRKVVVLGDMLELGSYEEEGHRLVGRRVHEVADLLVVVGNRARWVALEAQDQGMSSDKVIIAQDNDDVVGKVRPLLQQGDVVLIKGSRGAALEQVVAALQRQAEEAN